MPDSTRSTRFRFWMWLIRMIGVIVPRRLRTDWRQEWEAELRHREAMLAEWDRLDWRNKLDLMWRSTSAFWDALWMQTYRWEDAMIQDVRYGARMLMKSPGFTLMAVITFALGIGANSAIFSGVNTILYKPLPATQNPSELCHVTLEDRQRGSRGAIAYPDFEYLQRSTSSLAGLAAYSLNEAEWSFNGLRKSINGELISGNYFQLLGVRARIGRMIVPEDEVASENAVVLSDVTWRQYFAADSGIIGKQIVIENQNFTVVGVTPPAFQGTTLPLASGWWIASKRAPMANGTKEHRCFLIGRLNPESTPRTAQAELEVIFSALKQAQPEAYKATVISVVPARGYYFDSGDRDELYPMIAITIAVVGITLLIACANVASFLLARAIGRRREIAVRLALGASRWRIARMLLTESVLLALLGGVAAAALNFWTTNLLSHALKAITTEGPASVDLSLDFSPDWTVFFATFLISLVVGVVSGLVPARQASKADLTPSLKDEVSWLASGRRRLSWRNALVVSQVAGSLMLLIGSGLFMRSVQEALRVDPGFVSERLSLNKITIDRKGYSDARAEQFFHDLERQVAALPNVQSLGLAEGTLPDGESYFRDNRLWVARSEEMPFGYRQLEVFQIGPEFFETAGISMIAGRDFTQRDSSDRVVIINEVIARRAFPGRDPVGQLLRLQQNGEPLEIIGVVKDVKHHSLGEPAEPYLYQPIERYSGYRSNYLVLFVRTRNDPAATLPAIAALIKTLDPNITFTQLTMAENVDKQMLPSKMAAAFFGLFGALGLILAAIGLSGVLAYAVARRTKEMGIRMALGAGSGDVLRMIIVEGLTLTFAGIVIGLMLALVLTRVLQSFLYGISAADPLAYLSTTVLLAATAILACYFPARRASRVDPAVALRRE